MSKLLLAFEEGTISDAQLAEIRDVAPDLEIVQSSDKSEIADQIAEWEIVVGAFPFDLLQNAKNLQWFQQWSAGADWLLDHPEVQKMDFTLTNASGVHAIPISEHIIATLLAMARNLPAAWRAQQQKLWMDENDDGADPDQPTYRRQDVFEAAGKTLLMLGVGEIGERAAKIAEALEMHVIALRHNPNQETPGADETVGDDELLDVLPKADVVVSTVPLTNETRHMLDKKAFAAMKEGVYFINIGRGETIDESALIDALQSGKVAGAALDVFETEPLPEESPLWAMKNVIITPHASGATSHYDTRAFAIFLDNLQRYVAGKALKNIVDKTKGY